MWVHIFKTKQFHWNYIECCESKVIMGMQLKVWMTSILLPNRSHILEALFKLAKETCV
jgi:hypothetical protein